ncbi:hypothetical protein NPIL_588001 [Nephila pilipes]|uniref:Uncharacterized protein n=1 Tax=Nephila pilipes TaxID=299642 RepID=A0A8X6TFE4_NEPPI|nr:hypothetical protein NPIL_588001 [Nephila pilipes]
MDNGMDCSLNTSSPQPAPASIPDEVSSSLGLITPLSSKQCSHLISLVNPSSYDCLSQLIFNILNEPGSEINLPITKQKNLLMLDHILHRSALNLQIEETNLINNNLKCENIK